MSKEKHGAFVKNAADRKQVKEAGAKERELDRQHLQDIKNVMQTKSGRNLIWRIINGLCHYDTISAAPSGSLTYMNEGERNIGRILKAGVYKAAFPEWQLMEKEHVTKALDEQRIVKED